jgi:PEGA domain
VDTQIGVSMDILRKIRASVRRSSRCVLVFSLLLPLICRPARGQAAAEASGATSVSATPSVAKQTTFPSTVIPQGKDKSQHLTISPAPSPETANRQALEQRAGKDAGKLLLRSTPTGARVWIDGALVGNAPLLLIVAPGKYRVEMRSERSERAERAVALLPGETVEFVLPLVPRYPARVSVH